MGRYNGKKAFYLHVICLFMQKTPAKLLELSIEEGYDKNSTEEINTYKFNMSIPNKEAGATNVKFEYKIIHTAIYICLHMHKSYLRRMYINVYNFGCHG